MRYADAAVLPAMNNAYTASMFPMKFFEYLAGGLQVIATRLPALKEFKELYFPTDDADSFAAAVTAVLPPRSIWPAVSIAGPHVLNAWKQH